LLFKRRVLRPARNQTKTKTNFCGVTATEKVFICFQLLNRQQTKEASVRHLTPQSKALPLITRTGGQKENKTLGTRGIFVEVCELNQKHKSVKNKKNKRIKNAEKNVICLAKGRN